MSDLNSLSVIGRLGHDPEVRSLPSGDPVTNISLATSESWKDKATGEKRERTTWFRVAFFGELAEVAGEYLRKGSLVYVEGPVSARAYKTREGEPAASLEVRANQLRMLSSKAETAAPTGDAGMWPAASREVAKPAPAPAVGAPDFNDDIPF